VRAAKLARYRKAPPNEGRRSRTDVSPLLAAAAALWVAELELPVDPVEIAIH
jgi:hypothetical protein